VASLNRHAPASSSGPVVLDRLISRTERVLPYLSGPALDRALREQKRLKEKLKCV
jgi:hypothetical protein